MIYVLRRLDYNWRFSLVEARLQVSSTSDLKIDEIFSHLAKFKDNGSLCFTADESLSLWVYLFVACGINKGRESEKRSYKADYANINKPSVSSEWKQTFAFCFSCFIQKSAYWECLIDAGSWANLTFTQKNHAQCPKHRESQFVDIVVSSDCVLPREIALRHNTKHDLIFTNAVSSSLRKLFALFIAKNILRSDFKQPALCLAMQHLIWLLVLNNNWKHV